MSEFEIDAISELRSLNKKMDKLIMLLEKIVSA